MLLEEKNHERGDPARKQLGKRDSSPVRHSEKNSVMHGDLSEQRVVRQFVEALLFEELVDYQSAPISSATAPSFKFSPVYNLLLTFEVGSHVYLCAAALTSFCRMRVADGSVRKLGRENEPVGIVELVTHLDISEKSKDVLREELTQTVTLCRWNRKHLTHHLRTRRTLGFQALESAIFEGHLYHPCFKTRTGFSLLDHQKYGPEAGNSFKLSWLAIVRRDVSAHLPEDEERFWRKELGSLDYELLTVRLQNSGGDVRKYSLVPIHPWQLRTLGPRGLDRAIKHRDILSLGEVGDLYQATQSLRTLVNVTHPEKANIKLPLNVVCTSSHRNLRNHFVCTAPPISTWLDSLVGNDAFLQESGHLMLLKEYAAILYVPPAEVAGSETSEHPLEGMVGVIFRESICKKIEADLEAVPFTALMLVESDGRPFIADWLVKHGTERWANRLIEVMVIPVWHMLVHCGVALEAHAQNLIFVHKGGWPERIALRDFHEATEFVSDYLANPDLLPDFESLDPFFKALEDDIGYRMASTDALRELVMDTLYVFNLSDLSFLLERFCDFEEGDFWTLVRNHLLAYKQSGVTDPSRIERVGSGEHELIVESLLTKKIRGGGELDYFEHTIKNTLQGCG